MNSQTNKIIQVVGISGVGKSYLLDNYQKTFGKKYSIIDFGKELNKLVQKEAWEILARDGLKNVDREIIEKCTFHLLEGIIQSCQPVILNTHLVLEQDGQLIYDFETEKKINSLAYLHIIASPEDICQRRIDDLKNRKRTIKTIDEIAEHQNLSLDKTRETAKKIDAGFHIIPNLSHMVKPKLELMHYLFTKYFQE